LCQGTVAAVLATCAGASHAQGTTRAVELTPLFSASESVTQTAGRLNGFNGTEFVTRVSPGLRLVSRSGRVQGSLSYLLNASHYSEHPNARALESWLSTAFTAEVIDNWLYVDAQGSISQQALSAYGEQTLPDSLQTSANRVTTGTATISPYVRGSIGERAEYSVRLLAAATEVKDTSDTDSVTTGASASLGSRNSNSTFGWLLNANHEAVDFKLGRQTVTDRATATAILRPTYGLLLSANVGREATNVGTLERTSYNNWGAGARWTPTHRTLVSLQTDKRYFGRSHALVFEHRTPRSAWRYSDVRDSTSGSNPKGVGQPVTLYDLLYSQMASLQPDPALRDQAVREYLRLIGRDPNETVAGGVLNSGVALQRRQDFSWGLLGKRTTLTLQAYASDSHLLDNPAQVADNGEVHLKGYSATVSHRLTPLATLTLTGSRSETLPSASQAGNDLNSLLLGWTSQVARRMHATLMARYTVFHSQTDPYRESALTATLTMQF
jgi:uncharacterized protein (PEP-CTERM system associated)